MSIEMFVKQNFINGMAAQEEIHKGKKRMKSNVRKNAWRKFCLHEGTKIYETLLYWFTPYTKVLIILGSFRKYMKYQGKILFYDPKITFEAIENKD